jgi:uncharacterized protein
LAPKKISAKEVLVDIRAGMSSTELGHKYGISANGTQLLFDRLLAANLLDGEEHQRLSTPSAPSPEPGAIGDSAADEQEATEQLESSFAKTQLLRRFEDDDKPPNTGSTRISEPVEPTAQPSPNEHETQEAPVSTPVEFLDLAKQGRNQWWRYLISILFVLVIPVVATETVVEMAGWQIDPKTGHLVGIDPFFDYILLNLSMVFMLGCLVFVVCLVHRRPLLSLFTPTRAINWKNLATSFGLFFALIALATVIEYALNPATFEINQKLNRVLLLAPIVLVLTPIQTTTEELLFRGYLLQMMGLLTRNRAVLVIISGLLFMLPHLANPEVAAGFLPIALYYFACGCFLTVVTLKSNGLETAIGIHAAMNLFIALVVNYANSALTTSSIFFSGVINPVFSLVSFCIIAVVFYLLLFRGKTSFQRS